MSSITRAGATLAIGTFIALIVFFVLSTPMTTMFNSFDNLDAGEATDEMNDFLPDIQNAFWLGMAIFIITAAVVFIFWIFHREPDWFYRDRRY